MKEVSRRTFLKTLGVGITVATLQQLPMTTAFADSSVNKEKIVAEINNVYRAKGMTFRINEISFDAGNCSLENLSKDIAALKKIQVETRNVSVDKKQNDSTPEIDTLRAPMPVSFSKTVTDSLYVFFDEGTFCEVYIDVTISGTIDLQYNDIWSSSGTAVEKNGVNVDYLNIGSVSTQNDSPSKGYVSYSCPCSARFAWTSPYSGVKYSGTDQKTIQGSFAP